MAARNAQVRHGRLLVVLVKPDALGQVRGERAIAPAAKRASAQRAKYFAQMLVLVQQ